MASSGSFWHTSSVMQLRRSIDAQVAHAVSAASDAAVVQLAGAAIWSSVDSPGLLCVRVVRGQAWITQEGSPHDVILVAGQVFCSARRGKIVVQPVEPSTIELSRADCACAR